jgi:signal transduction histidine kinase
MKLINSLPEIRWRFSSFVTLAVLTIVSISITIYCLYLGWYILFQNLFFIPIIYACMHYPLRGMVFSVFLSVLYFLLILAFSNDSNVVTQAFVKVFMYIGVAGITSFLTIKQRQIEELVKIKTEELNKANNSLRIEVEREKEYELMLQKSLEKEKELSNLKSKFISITSHEFRTPLTTLSLSANLIQQFGSNWSEERKNEHFDRINKSVKRITDLLEDILTLNRAEAGEISFKPEEVDLYACSKDCIEDSKSLIKHNHKLLLNYTSDEKVFYLDPKLMRFMLNNLLSNAIKFSINGGTIKLTISADEKYLSIVISDEGIGIPADEIGMVFDSFHRARNAANMAGTELGLAIVKRAVELHNGEITVSSVLYRGTKFMIKIPKVSAD